VGVPDGRAVIGARVSPMFVGAALVGAAAANAPMDTRRQATELQRYVGPGGKYRPSPLGCTAAGCWHHCRR
jgi:hypothetical protein